MLIGFCKDNFIYLNLKFRNDKNLQKSIILSIYFETLRE